MVLVRTIAVALAAWLSAWTANAQANAVDAPMVVRAHRARVSLIVVQPDGSEVEPCRRMSSRETCVSREWYSEPGTYVVRIAIGNEPTMSSEMTVYGDELELRVSVARHETRVDVDRAAPVGLALHRGRDWSHERSGEGWAPYVLVNKSRHEFNQIAFQQVLYGTTERLDRNGHWVEERSGLDCAWGMELVPVLVRGRYPAGGVNAATPSDARLAPGHYRFVLRVHAGARGSGPLSVYSHWLVTHEFDIP